MRNNIVFIGEDTRTNDELYQLFNWRFNVTYYNDPEKSSFQEISAAKPTIIVVNMVESKHDYSALFEYFVEKCADVPVVVISAASENAAYKKFYDKEQFHRILHPTTGRRILETCRVIIFGKNTTKEEKVVSHSNGEKPHILVVDDNAMVLRNIKGVLENTYSVAVAPSGFHSFVSIGKKKPDLILLDYEMPEMNGKEVMTKLQSEEEFADIPVVFLTSADSKEIVMELMALRPAGYILKPVESQKLLDRIAGIIGK